MKLLHRIFFNAIKSEIPDKIEELAKPEVAKAIQSIKQKHTAERYAQILKSAYNGLSVLNEAVAESPNEYDDAGLRIFLDPIREAAAADGITL
jgi:hypothetical protein